MREMCEKAFDCIFYQHWNMFLIGLSYPKWSEGPWKSMIVMVLIMPALTRLLLGVIDIKNARHVKKGLAKN